jgi:ankyrin repeat protein
MKKSLLTLVLLTLSFNVLSQALLSGPTFELHKYLLSFDANFSTKPELSVVKQFVDNGADVKAIGITGGNAVHLAIESWSYSTYEADSGSDQASYELVKIMEYLIAQGSDHTIEDNRQLTGLYAAMRWGLSNPVFSKVFSILVKNNDNLNNSDLDGFTMAHLLARGRLVTQEQFKILLAGGLDLTKITKNGLSIAHKAVVSIPKSGESLYLEELLELIPSLEIRKNIALSTLDDGNTPLHFAVRSKNIAAIKFLVENYQADINKLNNSMRSPYSISIEKNLLDIKGYFELKGAKLIVEAEDISCVKRNNFDITYEKIVEVIKHCNFKKMKNLLKVLPAKYLGQHTVAFFTLAAQDASPEYPQILVYGETGETLMTFNGHHSQNGFSNLEFVVYRDKTKNFEMRDIRFPKTRNGDVSFSKKNPARCTTCHGQDPIPLWDSWTTWPGKFLGESASRTPVENKYYQQFLSNRSYGRYKHLPAITYEPIKTHLEELNLGKFANSKMDNIVAGLMSQKISKDLKSPRLDKYRYALLGALSCSAPIADFIPKKISDAYYLGLKYLEEDTRNKSTNEMANRLELLKEIIPGGPQTRYVIQSQLFLKTIRQKNRAGMNADIKRTSHIRYIVENAGLSMKSWFTPFNRGLESYMMPSWNGIEVEAWKFLLDKKIDSKIYKIYKKKRNGFAFYQGFNPFFYKSKEESKVCDELKIKSLKALSI